MYLGILYYIRYLQKRFSYTNASDAVNKNESKCFFQN